MLTQPPEHDYDVATALSLAFSVLSYSYVVYGHCVEVYKFTATHGSTQIDTVLLGQQSLSSFLVGALLLKEVGAPINCLRVGHLG